MSTAAAVDTLEALFRKVDSEVESIICDLDANSSGDQATVGQVALRLTKVRQNFETLKAEVASLQRDRQQCTEQLSAELGQFSELFDQLTARVGPVPSLDPPPADSPDQADR